MKIFESFSGKPYFGPSNAFVQKGSPKVVDYSFLNKQMQDPARIAWDKKQEEDEQAAYNKRMERLSMLKEWYSFSEEERVNVGSQLYPVLETPKGGFTTENAKQLGILKGYDDPELFSGTKKEDRYSSIASFNPDQRIKTVDYNAEGQPIYSFANAAPSVASGTTDPLASIRKFSEVALEENYFGQNQDLNTFLTQTGKEFVDLKAKQTPAALKAAQTKALEQRIESTLTPSTSGRTELKRNLSGGAKNTLRIGGVADTDETSVNIPT
jgi:hypothetical protein